MEQNQKNPTINELNEKQNFVKLYNYKDLVGIKVTYDTKEEKQDPVFMLVSIDKSNKITKIHNKTEEELEEIYNSDEYIENMFFSNNDFLKLTHTTESDYFHINGFKCIDGAVKLEKGWFFTQFCFCVLCIKYAISKFGTFEEKQLFNSHCFKEKKLGELITYNKKLKHISEKGIRIERINKKKKNKKDQIFERNNAIAYFDNLKFKKIEKIVDNHLLRFAIKNRKLNKINNYYVVFDELNRKVLSKYINRISTNKDFMLIVNFMFIKKISFLKMLFINNEEDSEESYLNIITNYILNDKDFSFITNNLNYDKTKFKIYKIN